jgi:hypothetical protein
MSGATRLSKKWKVGSRRLAAVEVIAAEVIAAMEVIAAVEVMAAVEVIAAEVIAAEVIHVGGNQQNWAMQQLRLQRQHQHRKLRMQRQQRSNRAVITLFIITLIPRGTITLIPGLRRHLDIMG